MKLQKYHGIEIEAGAESINPFYFYFRKIGISLLILFLIFTFLGFFSSGYFSYRSIENNFFSIHYQKFLRLQSTSAYEIVVHYPNMCANEKLKIWLHSDFFAGVAFKEMNPKPRGQIIMNDKTLLIFDCDKGTESAKINIIVETEKFGLHRSQLGIENEVIYLSQFIYP